jgi:hypothetical protein
MPSHLGSTGGEPDLSYSFMRKAEASAQQIP